MKPKYYLIVAFSILLLLTLCVAAQAEVYRLYFNAHATSFGDPPIERMNFLVIISDTSLRPPDAIASITVTAPDGTVFDMTDNTWIEFGEVFWGEYQAGDFDSGEIPSGKYVVRVVDKWGKKAWNYDRVNVAFLDLPEITYPTEGSTVGSLTPNIRWAKVPGAQYYQLFLWNNSWNQPVYSRPHTVKYVYKTHFKIPKGVLRPGTYYRVQIEAYDRDKDEENLSRSGWVNFNTP